MSGMAGFVDFTGSMEGNKRADIIQNMSENNKGISHFTISNFSITLDGEIYNSELNSAENLLQSFIYYYNRTSPMHENIHHFVNTINGCFSFVINISSDLPSENKLFLFRDRLGTKPLFYSISDDFFVYGSRIKTILRFPYIKPEVDNNGLCEIFAIGPAKTPGKTVFKHIHEILPAHYGIVEGRDLTQHRYWRLESKVHTDSYEDTIAHVSFLLKDAVTMQSSSPVSPPVCSLLSGGVDSCSVTSIANAHVSEKGLPLPTLSFDFTDNDKHFVKNSFQPDRDRPWIDKTIAFLDKTYGPSDRFYLECDYDTLFDSLCASAEARDYPGMADVDGSLLFFCAEMKQLVADGRISPYALTGECADEVFGGYPWFHREELLFADTFPWARNTAPRSMLLSDELIGKLDIDTYMRNSYENALKQVSRLDTCDGLGESTMDARRREVAQLTFEWFLPTLLTRMERMSAVSGITGRVPFADHRLVEYVFNAPWSMKAKDGMVKHLLRKACEGILPDEIVYRPKSPFPKTYNPAYENLLKACVRDIIDDNASPVHRFCDKAKLQTLVTKPADYVQPWFGQLMAGPQLLAYFIQFEFWLKKYNPVI